MFQNLKKVFRSSTKLLGITLLCFFGGCGPGTTGNGQNVNINNSSAQLTAYIDYTAVKCEIVPITEMSPENNQGTKIKVYVSLSDSAGSQIKTPGVFRFELYEYVPRSADPKAERLFIWPDIDLREFGQNNKLWRDFLRAYEFNLTYDKSSIKRGILVITCICSNGKRLGNEFDLKAKP
jgi:hypothetical protein